VQECNIARPCRARAWPSTADGGRQFCAPRRERRTAASAAATTNKRGRRASICEGACALRRTLASGGQLAHHLRQRFLPKIVRKHRPGRGNAAVHGRQTLRIVQAWFGRPLLIVSWRFRFSSEPRQKTSAAEAAFPLLRLLNRSATVGLGRSVAFLDLLGRTFSWFTLQAFRLLTALLCFWHHHLPRSSRFIAAM